MQYLIHTRELDMTPLRASERRGRGRRPLRPKADVAVRVHQKVLGWLTVLLLLVAYDMASRIDSHIDNRVDCSPIAVPSAAGPVAEAAINRF